MGTISVDKTLKKRWPEIALGVLEYEVSVSPSHEALLAVFDGEMEKRAKSLSLEEIASLPHVAATRRGYKALGKDPHAYRNAAEAMLRRVVKGKGLYHINNVVEINNLISVNSGYSIGSYDCGQLQGDVVLTHAPVDVHYDGIGKGSVNIGNLPVLQDELGFFGNPTSDSHRAMIQTGQRHVLTVLYAFDGRGDLEEWMEQYRQLLMQFCGVKAVESKILEG